MINLIVGKKGSGKTKKLVDLVNKTIEKSSGNVVVIESGSTLTYDVNHNAKLIDCEQYGINCYSCFYGFICGICASNYDVTDIFSDSVLKICGSDDKDKLNNLIKQLNTLSTKCNINIVLSDCIDGNDLYEDVKSIVNIIM